MEAPAMATPSFDGAAPINAPEPAPVMEAPAMPAMSAPKMPAPSAASVSVSNDVAEKLDSVAAQMDDIAARMDKLERNLSKVEKRGSDISSLSQELKAVKAQVKATKSTMSAERVDAPAMPKAQTAVKSSSTHAKDVWVLKGIAQGQAWIAKEGSNDIKKVTVGDTVQGLGKITSVGLENNVWTVRGSQGSVTQ